MNQETIQKAVEHVDLSNAKTIAEAANMILEDSAIKKGATVAVIDDPTYSMAGLQGKVTSLDKVGYAEVQMEDGTNVSLMINQLVLIK